MCGRFAQAIPVSTLKIFFDIQKILSHTPPSYNITPSHEILTITAEKERTLRTMTWGFIPGWGREKTAPFKPLINARAETLREKPAFRNSFKHKRCLIIADGFYEWQTQGKEKIPYFIKLTSGDPMAFAGIYERYIPEKGGEILTCAIITTAAGNCLEQIHNRMPVIIPKKNINIWLDTTCELNESGSGRIFAPIPDNKITFYQVSRDVNSPLNNNPELIIPV